MNGTLLVNRSEKGSHLHCAREEDIAWPRTHYTVEDGQIFCDNLVVFPYLTDVNPGDGGLIVLPGSHKAEFVRPPGMFYAEGKITDEIPAGVVNITPKAGDIVIISEALTHGTLTWKPDRDRRALVLRYRPQHLGGATEEYIPEEVQERLLPETQELLAKQDYNTIKRIADKHQATAA
jgi:ectoine hydroxylase-related dioxygenase (phytanoyl-CoA dioxygenase family)